MNNYSKTNLYDNCADYIRLFAALSIVYGHTSFWLKAPGWDAWNFLNAFYGLILLFALSGYFISASLERNSSAKAYLINRFIRIYPSLWVAFLLSALLVISFIFYHHIPISTKAWVEWVVAQVTIFQFYTPEELKVYGVGHPNGPLWMIPIQVSIYVLFLFTYKILKRFALWGWLLFLAALIGVAALSPSIISSLPIVLGKLFCFSPIPYAYIFYIAMFIYIYRCRLLPILCQFFWPMLVIYLLWFYGNKYFFHFEFGIYVNTISGIFMTLLTIACAYKFGRHSLRNDYSYGIYLFHFILINIMYNIHCVGNWYCIAIVYLATFILAYLSHHFIDKPIARRFKS